VGLRLARGLSSVVSGPVGAVFGLNSGSSIGSLQRTGAYTSPDSVRTTFGPPPFKGEYDGGTWYAPCSKGIHPNPRIRAALLNNQRAHYSAPNLHQAWSRPRSILCQRDSRCSSPSG